MTDTHVLKRLFCVSTLFVMGFWTSGAYCDTHRAKNLTSEAVWDAFNAASDGDVIQLPAGEAIWTKGWSYGHFVDMKAVTFQGAGIDKTIIHDGTDDSWWQTYNDPFVMKGVKGKPFRITGITFSGVGYPKAGNSQGMLSISGDCKNWRIDHCRFIGNCKFMHLGNNDWKGTYGLIDHCCFEYPGVFAQPQMIFCGGGQSAAYKGELNAGSADAIYFEDNYFYCSAAQSNASGGNNPLLGTWGGTRIVFRHNNVVNTRLEIEDAGFVFQDTRGSLLTEAYGNIFTYEPEITTKYPKPHFFLFIGSGVGIIFDNQSYSSNGDEYWIELWFRRACQKFGATFGRCDGTSKVDGNLDKSGYPCLDQIGRGMDDPKGSKVQIQSPCYEWDNTINGVDMDYKVRTDICREIIDLVKENRDFYNDTRMPGYTPYTYPHPLTKGDSRSYVSTPTISPRGGHFKGSATVTFACATSGATIRYTTDGTEPTSSSREYTAPFSLSATTKPKAKAFKSGLKDSTTAHAIFVKGTK